MARPIVLVATTDPNMAYALQERLKDDCKKLGLKLEVCPDGNESDMAGAKVCSYDSAEELFDALEKRDPVELADTLVVLDVGAGLDNAFRPAANQDKWHVTSNRAGIAVELLLRFPQVFPVFLSPAVPVSTDEANAEGNDKGKIVKSTLRNDNEWGGFYRLCDEICTKHKPGQPDLEACKSLHAFQVPLHFVSPLYGDGLVSTLDRFARGMRCWFDPTGLRTLVKNRFLGTLFGNENNWENTWSKADDKQDNSSQTGLREILLERLDCMGVAIDEEREFAMLNAYAAWKHGRRAWIVTTYDGFHNHPLWAANCNNIAIEENYRCNRDVVVLRDIDLRFPDIPTDKEDIRANLRDITSKDIWDVKLAPKWNVSAVSSHPNVLTEEKFSSLAAKDEKAMLVGQFKMANGEGKKDVYWYKGLSKPIATLYQLKSLLRKDRSTLSLLGTARDRNGGGRHGAPYLNLSMAESLLISSGRCKDQSSSHLIGALLAMEAYELLLGMSKTTALEALLALHKHEAAAEVKFPGVSHSLEIKDRIEDVEHTLNKLYEDNKTNAREKERVKRMFLSQFWAELRIQYKDGEQFDAAEEANVQSLLNMSWKPFVLPKPVKSLILKISTSIVYWFLGAFCVSLILTAAYAKLEGLQLQLNYEGMKLFLQIWSSVVLAMIQLQFNEVPIVAYPLKAEFWHHLLAIIHLGISYVLFGFLIAMIYRKITRA